MSTISSSTTSGSQVLTALGGTSTIDTGALITSLVSASYDPKTAAIKTKATANTAKISELATLNNKIDSFSSAFKTLIDGGTLATQPTSSNTAVLTATAKAGSAIGALSAQLSVRQIAQAQSLASASYPSGATTIGTGTLTIAVGGKTTSIAIGSGNASLAGIAAAINGSGSGVTATVVTDSSGARLTLKGATGADNAFVVAVSPASDAGLAALGYGIANGMAASGSAALSTVFSDPATSPVGQGSFTLTGPAGSATLAIDASNDNLNGLAAAINGSGTGLTATVVTDPDGYRLSISDGTSAGTGFTLAPAADAKAGLARFAWPAPSPAPGLARTQTAQDAIVRIEGIDVTRPSNTIDDLVDGVSLSLVSASPAETVSLTATRPTAALKQAVSDFVAAYNEMKSEIDTASAASVTAADSTTSAGPLYGNAAVRQMQTQLARLTSTVLNTGGGPRTLADIGVSTNRDGTLGLDDGALTKALAAYPDAVEAMFNPTQRTSSPLVKIASAIGAVTPGSYALTDIVAASGSTSASGKIDGTALVTTGSKLYASVSSKASGLVIEPQGDVASATVTIDLGLGGALKAIRDGLRASGGVLDALSTQLATEKTDLADEQTKITADQSAYEERLTAQFSTMNTRVANFTAIKSYLTQQIAVWTKSSN